MATFVADNAGVDRNLKFGTLNETQIAADPDRAAEHQYDSPRLDDEPAQGPVHRVRTTHLISVEVATRLRDDINLMKMIRSYRGVRHEAGLPVRGQRTRANGRFGLALGVSKRREVKPAAGGAKKEE